MQNHPRWDPDISLEQSSPGPLGVGTVIRRTNHRYGAPVEGTMTCTEFDPPRAMAFTIEDGPLLSYGRLEVEPVGQGSSRVTLSVHVPSRYDDAGPLPIQRSADGIRTLIEAET